MTSVLRHSQLPYKNVLDGQVETLIPVERTRSHPDITIGTSIKAAWAVVLAEMSGSTDVVFGSVVSGRNAPYPPGVENVAGACIENIPVRVRFRPGMMVMELLKQVQEQYFAAVSFESFGFKRIVEQCTDWRPWERLSSLVEYENLGEEIETFPFEKSTVRMNEIRPPADRHDITIFSMPLGSQTFLALDFCTQVIPQSLAQHLLDRLCFHLQNFSADVQASLVISPQMGNNSIPRFPLDGDCMANRESSRRQTARLVNGLNVASAEIEKIVQEAWITTMGCTEGRFSETQCFENTLL